MRPPRHAPSPISPSASDLNGWAPAARTFQFALGNPPRRSERALAKVRARLPGITVIPLELDHRAQEFPLRSLFSTSSAECPRRPSCLASSRGTWSSALMPALEYAAHDKRHPCAPFPGPACARLERLISPADADTRAICTRRVARGRHVAPAPSAAGVNDPKKAQASGTFARNLPTPRAPRFTGSSIHILRWEKWP